MRITWSGLLAVISCVVVLDAQSSLPPDVHPQSLSRLPPIGRDSLDQEGQRIFDVIAGDDGELPRTGPAPTSMYSPKVAEVMNTLNQYLRTIEVGSRYFELSALVAAWEFDQQYEWSGHEPAGLRAGLEQSVIDAVKYDRNVSGLPEKEATIIRLGRALFREHEVSSELWAKTVELFGRKGAFEITAVMGDYVMAAVMLTAVDQQLPPERKALLPRR